MSVACIYPPPGSVPQHRIRVGAREWRFEMHPYCGPSVVGKGGDPLSAQPGPRSHFWDAVTAWSQKGHRADASGLCIWGD